MFLFHLHFSVNLFFFFFYVCKEEPDHVCLRMQTIQNCAFYYHSSGPVSFSLTTTGVSQERTHGTSFRLSVLPSCSHRELFSGSMHRWERTQRVFFFFLTGDQKQGAVLMPKIQHSGDLGRGTAVS